MNLVEKIQKFVDLITDDYVKITENTSGVISYAYTSDCDKITFDRRSANLIFTENFMFINAFFENIEYINECDKENFKKENPVIVSILHELGHYLTKDLLFKCFVNGDYTRAYEKDSYKAYREIPSEKIADNIAYLIWHHNNHIIKDIMEEKKIEIKKDLKDYNKKIVNQYLNINSKITRKVVTK